jgi:hypothetical protein
VNDSYEYALRKLLRFLVSCFLACQAFRQPEVHPYDHWGPQKKRNPLQTAEAVTDWLKQQVRILQTSA